MKKLLVIVIATVLVLGVIGGCFALYYVGASDVTVNIGANYEAYTLQIKDGAGTSAQDSIALTFDGDANATKTVDLTLTVDHPSLVDGHHGIFAIALSGDLASSLDVTVNTLAAAQGAVTGSITAAATGAGYDIALSSTPVYVRLTFALNADALANYASVAEKTATLSVTWEVAADSVWTYDDDAYYLVGTINGADKWTVSPANENIELTKVTNDGNNVAKVLGVSLTAGDEIKVVWNFKEVGESAQWYGNGDGSNVVIGTTGIYNIFLYDDNGYKVSAALAD